MSATYTIDQKTTAKDRLLEWLSGDKPTVWVNVTTVAKSGMSLRMRAYVVSEGDIIDATWHVSRVMDWPMNDDGIRLNGGGMDMTFHLVYELSHVLFGNGYAITKRNL